MNRYAIRRIFVWPAFKFGCLIGATLMVLPGVAQGLLARAVVRTLRGFLEGLGFFASTNPDIATLLDRLTILDHQGALIVLWITLGTVIFGGLLEGLLAALAALVYNFLAGISGGLEVGVDALSAPTGAAAPAAPPASTAPSAPRPQPAPAQPQAAPPIQPTPIPSQAGPATPVAAPAPGPYLALSQDPQRRWPVKAGITMLGSAPDSDVVLPGLASRHAEIRLEENRYVLYDLTGGQAWVNDRPVVERNMLKEGFRVRLGAVELVFQS
jgi:hypothetical protein